MSVLNSTIASIYQAIGSSNCTGTKQWSLSYWYAVSNWTTLKKFSFLISEITSLLLEAQVLRVFKGGCEGKGLCGALVEWYWQDKT
jgi:hypothetical protein